MKTRSMMLFVMLAAMSLLGGQYEDRWFYVSRNLNSDKELADVEALVRTAGKAKLNGMLLSCGVENYGSWMPDRKARLAQLRRTCEANGVAIIPIIWSVGYGTMLWRNPNLVEGIPCKDMPYVAKEGKAYCRREEAFPLENCDFERHDGDKFPLDGWIDAPGERSFADTEVAHGGKCSVRLENFTADKHGHGRICLSVKLTPYRRYRMKVFAKTEGLVPSKGHFMIQFYNKKGTQLAFVSPDIKPTQDWMEYSMLFSNGDIAEGYLYIGMWGGGKGTLWIDDISLEEDGVSNVIRRDGAPFTVKNAKSGELYVEGRDYGKVEGLKRLSDAPKESLVLNLPEDSRIKDGDELLVSFYQPAKGGKSQYSPCMSEPMLYDAFRDSAKHIVEALNPRKWFLSMDEIRSGGTCFACEVRHTDMAHILGDCITKQRQIIKEVRPDAEIYIWSDMLDPVHNAHDNYFNCKGSFEGVWNIIPKDLIISCWYHKKREQSMPFFEKLGFRTQAAAYYDADTLATSREWLETCNHTHNCTGIIYTSWRNKYALLEEFGKMVQEFSHPKD